MNGLTGICSPICSPAPVSTTTIAMKSGIVRANQFSGEPLTFDVVFDEAFASISYSIVITGVDSRSFTYESKTVNGFIINTNADGDLSGEVSWIATPIGEF